MMKANNVGDGATPSLFVQDVWLDEHEVFNHNSQRTWSMEDLLSQGWDDDHPTWFKNI